MDETLNVFQQGLLMVVWLSAPPLAVAIVVGVAISLLQTMLSLQDQALAFAAKLVAVAFLLAMLGRWLGLELMSLGERSLQAVATISYRGMSPPRTEAWSAPSFPARPMEKQHD